MRAYAGLIAVMMLGLVGCGSASPEAAPSGASSASSQPAGFPNVAGKTLAEASINLSSAGYYNYTHWVDGKFDPYAVRSDDDLSNFLVTSSDPSAGSDVSPKDHIKLNIVPNPDNPPKPRPSPTPSTEPMPAQTALVAPTPTATAAAPTPKKPKQSLVTYIVEADGPIGIITYTNFVGNKMGQEQASDEVWGPVEKSYEFDASNFESSYGFWSLGVSAQAGAGTSTVTCRIMHDGREISKQTSTGQYSVVTCNAGG
ncbi:hypothetical protein J2T11_000156 [Paenarthrobacter nicotinovorans]|uniref:PASTA domain-containing protein n=1 Tax=Paenarthrobacter nicotinovorans TaxID=29320 RepID=UPI002781ED36|nr:PASTA domain-containing protein [Paenarthrobacter nicotinovorans]MDP9933832.1 hypothetical protein [Paenarthrobacter nicotinovorans]